ncbi:MAG: DUF4169 family protein [Roseobacter sp.]
MTKPINLNKARKERAKAQKRARADENSVKFGRTSAQKERDEKSRSDAVRLLDGHKRDR